MSTESEQEQAAAIGACRVLEGRGLWRFIQRDWPASRALLLALLASGGCPAALLLAAASRPSFLAQLGFHFNCSFLTLLACPLIANAAAHTGTEAQAAIQRCFLITAFRLTCPAERDPAMVRCLA